MLLADGPTGARRTIDVAGAAAMAWVAPRHHLMSGTTRIRSSISVVAYAWTAMTAGALLFGQVTEGEPLRVIDNAHPGSHRLYAVYVNAAHLSVAAVVLGSLPLVWSLLRAARRQHRRDIPMLLLTPVVSLLSFVVVLVAITKLAHHSSTPGVGIGTGWFIPLLIAGIAAGSGCVAGPAAAIRRIEPDRGPLLLGVVAMALAVATMLVVTVSTFAYGVALNRIAPQYEASSWSFLSVYGAAMAIAVSTAICSTSRGLKATRA